MSLIKTYSGQMLLPSREKELAIADTVKLAPGTYSKGTVLGQYSGVTGASEIQTATVNGTPTGGTFRLALQDKPTVALAHNASAAVVQAALEALENIGAGNVTVGLTSNVYTITFQGDLALQDIPLLTLYSNSLTGGTSPTVALATTTAGRAAGSYFGAYDNALSNGLETARCLLKYETVVNTKGQHTTASEFFGETSDNYVAEAYFRGTFYTGDGSALLLPGLDANAVTDLGRMVSGLSSALTALNAELRIG